MTDATIVADCTCTDLTNVPSDSSSGCSTVRKHQRARAMKFTTGFLALCAICCAIPPALIGLGFIGITTGAYLSIGSTAALIALAMLGLGYLLIRYIKKGH